MNRRLDDQEGKGGAGERWRGESSRASHERARERYREDDELMHRHNDRYDSSHDDRHRYDGSHDDHHRYDDRRDERGRYGSRHDDRGRDDESRLRGRYDYGAEEERKTWGEPRPGDGEGY